MTIAGTRFHCTTANTWTDFRFTQHLRTAIISSGFCSNHNKPFTTTCNNFHRSACKLLAGICTSLHCATAGTRTGSHWAEYHLSASRCSGFCCTRHKPVAASSICCHCTHRWHNVCLGELRWCTHNPLMEICTCIDFFVPIECVRLRARTRCGRALVMINQTRKEGYFILESLLFVV